MAKVVNTFRAKGELDLASGKIYELKKKGGDEEVIEVDFMEFLQEFDGSHISITIMEEREVAEYKYEETEDDEEDSDE